MSRTLISLVMVLALLMAVALLASPSLPMSSAQAQETPTAASLHGLLERLRGRMEADASFSFDVHFISPLIPGEPSWQIPAALSDAGASRTLGEIGDDYVCFVERGQTFDDSVCIPYTNIKMLVYPNAP